MAVSRGWRTHGGVSLIGATPRFRQKCRRMPHATPAICEKSAQGVENISSPPEWVHLRYKGFHNLNLPSHSSDTKAKRQTVDELSLRVSPHISIRAIQVEYLHTDFGGSKQNNMRVETGLVYHFGGKK
jgi:hypothetical protein